MAFGWFGGRISFTKQGGFFMRNYLNAEWVNRLLFTVIALGILMVLAAGARYVDLALRLANNPATVIQESGREVDLESMTDSQKTRLMSISLEQRRMVAEQLNMMVLGGVGLALVGLGWLTGDIIRSRRRKAEEFSEKPNPPAQAVS